VIKLMGIFLFRGTKHPQVTNNKKYNNEEMKTI